MSFRIAIIAGLVAYAAFVWLATVMLKLTGVDLWVVRGFLCLIGISGAGIFWWWKSRREKQKAGGAGQADTGGAAGGADEIDFLIRDADARLSASNQGRIANLPAILLLGPPGSAKTNTMLHSGLEPDMLAGQIYQDNAVLPTRSANLWFSRQTVFIEAGGRLITEPARWARLIKKIEPRRLTTALGKGQQAPRAAVVCFDLEEFLKPGASETIPVVIRNLHARLGEVSQMLGISFPVYVLFTKADRVPFFLDYLRNFSHEEATQVFGATLPIVTGQPAGIYADQATQRLNYAFDELFYSICDKRPDYLAREHAGDKLPGIYEFPREFRKLRSAVVQFLVDISKPSQLRAAPFLRGFYFSGVRPVVVTEMAQPVAQRPAERLAFEGRTGATGLFRGVQQQAAAAPQAQAVGQKRVPQWVFVSHFWNDIILRDPAVATSGASVKTSTLRRVLLATAAGLCFLYAIALIVSYSRNSGMESRVEEAAQALATVAPTGQDVPSIDALKRLEALRQEVATLSDYEQDGAPLSMRWGLYTGSEIYPDAYRLYFSRFYSLLFGQTQAGMVASLRMLPPAPQPTDLYAPPYNTLKAYLITTSEWKRSTRDFLSPYLMTRWSEGKTGVDAERAELVRKQFDFYSEQLRLKNPFSTENEAQTVGRARAYLKQFNAEDRIYEGLLQEASQKFSVNYNDLYRNDAVFDGYTVRGAFTRDGWNAMQAALKKPVFGGEEWVLGPMSIDATQRVAMEQRLRARYVQDYIKEWRKFLGAASVSRYASLRDAAGKLEILSGNRSPLLQLFCLVSTHTAVDSADIKLAFAAPQMLVPAPACQNQLVAGANTPYVGALGQLLTSVRQVAESPNPANDPAAGATRQAALQALQTTGDVARAFPPDTQGNLDKLVFERMKDPITQVDRLLAGLGPGELRAKAQELCRQLNNLVAKYPFNLNNRNNPASLDDLGRIFRKPDGTLWQFYSQNLQQLMEQQGGRYVAKSGGPMTLTPQFVGFFNRVAQFSDALYPAGSPVPKLTYTVRSDLTNVQEQFQLTLDGQTFSNTRGRTATATLSWPGNSTGARLKAAATNDWVSWPFYDGVWGTFEFFYNAVERGGTLLEWQLRDQAGRPSVFASNDQPVIVRMSLEMSPPVFRKGYFNSWACTADVAR